MIEKKAVAAAVSSTTLARLSGSGGSSSCSEAGMRPVWRTTQLAATAPTTLPDVPQTPDRSAHFPAIERKYGQPMSYWFGVMKDLAGQKYPEQVAYLRENHGFSQAHANAVVMYARGSTSTRRFNSLAEYLKGKDQTGAATARAIFQVITDKYPEMKVVIAWNSPILKLGKDYIFGVHVGANYLLIAPFGGVGIAELAPRLNDYTVLKKTVRVPFDWKIDKRLVLDFVKIRLAELA